MLYIVVKDNGELTLQDLESPLDVKHIHEVACCSLIAYTHYILFARTGHDIMSKNVPLQHY